MKVINPILKYKQKKREEELKNRLLKGGEPIFYTSNHVITIPLKYE
jgi:hypothetical protein